MPYQGQANHPVACIIHSGQGRSRYHVPSPSRTVLLADQDRGRWNRDLIAERPAIVRCCLRGNQLGPYQIQAGDHRGAQLRGPAAATS
jgi:RNA polymerase sigma-70 factor, ECF subfamily